MNQEKLKALKAKLKNLAVKRGLVKEFLIDQLDLEPEWDSGDLNGYPANYPPRPGFAKRGVYQQSELLQPVLNDIASEGLHYVYNQYKKKLGDTQTKTSHPRNVIIVGAGIAGLSAAYELSKAGHSVQILEMQERTGGRIRTYGEKDGFAKNLYVDAGAMRLPDTPGTAVKTHYLTDFYASTKFHLPLVPFSNYDENAYLKFYNMEPPMKRSVWDTNSYQNFTDYWPGWDAKFSSCNRKYNIQSINDYYSATMDTIKFQLTSRLEGLTSNEEAAAIWNEWTINWSKFSLNGFLRSTLDMIKQTLEPDYLEAISGTLNEKALSDLLPWPEEALVAYSIFNYTEQLDQCLVQYLRDELAEWWSDNMHHIYGGMEHLPQKFTQRDGDVHLEKDIVYNVTVQKINYTYSIADHQNASVVVSAYHTISGQRFEFTGNAVIVTVPLHAIRQIEFVSSTSDFPNDFYQAVEDIWYGPSTKIMIQSKTKFWEGSGHNIKGGFSKTNLPIGQLHYPTANQISPRSADSAYDPGILLCYTWKAEALLFGSLPQKVAIQQAVRQIAQIHSEIEDNFEAGAIHAWYNDPAAQGAYALLKPHQYRHVRYLMMNPHKNIFFAGEGISHAAGWIQGALESALRAAYQFYVRNEEASRLKK